jgi:hypothetical protein
MKKPSFDSFVQIRTNQSESFNQESIYYPNNHWYEPRKPVGFSLLGVKKIKSEDDLKVERNISIELFETTVVFPPQLKNIADEICDSLFIVDLQDDWDNEGAVAINKELYRDSIQFLIDYSLALFNIHNVVIEAPEINPCRDGTIDISWKTGNVRLLLNFRLNNGHSKALFYRDHYNNEKSNKGELALDEIDESFLVWMKFLK